MPPIQPTLVSITPSSCQKRRSAPQKQPVAKYAIEFMRELLQYAQLFAPADNLHSDPLSPRSSGDRALPSGGRCTGSIPVGGTTDFK
ncbi:hypothetical protein FGO68_gene2795 [Halteria grandinella]|uniref:Uncharacterized protein n=1 Tax=Halteria grandinella TaxID=5974 RepID=A0A8J8N961_HALGN|nr:hypothetical protein FGO68_gene2795 [Halteria grandinella]